MSGVRNSRKEWLVLLVFAILFYFYFFRGARVFRLARQWGITVKAGLPCDIIGEQKSVCWFVIRYTNESVVMMYNSESFICILPHPSTSFSLSLSLLRLVILTNQTWWFDTAPLHQCPTSARTHERVRSARHSTMRRYRMPTVKHTRSHPSTPETETTEKCTTCRAIYL